MNGFNYTRLNSIANSVTPYRGTLNRFPIANRRENTKYFLVGEDNGERVFNIVYGTRNMHVNLTKEEYDLAAKQGDGRVFEYQGNYSRYEPVPNILGVVRPDNTFEFTSENGYGQGNRYFLSSFSHGYYTTDSRRGGVIWKMPRVGRMLPIFKGLRVGCDTMQPTKEFTLIGKKVNRKVGKDTLAHYENFYKVAEVMVKAMDYATFMSAAYEVLKDHEMVNEDKRFSYYMEPREEEHYRVKAESLTMDAPFDALVLYSMLFDTNSMRWNMRRYMDDGLVARYSRNDDHPHMMFINMKRKLNKEIYKQNADVFKPVEYKMGEVFPPSEWGYTIMVDGQEVMQYA